MKTEQKHTPGPWYISGYRQICGAGSPEPIRVAGGVSVPTGNHPAVAEAKANAARIVACVNACEGMADPEVWIGMQEKEAAFAKTEIPRLAGQVDTLSAEVERLREALAGVTRILEAFSYTTQLGKTQRARLEAARAALGAAA